MSPQYLVAKQCLHLLKESSIPCVKKLRLEIQFIQLLRLLLHEDLTGSESGPCSKEEFEAVYRSMFFIRHNGGSSDAVASVMERIGGILFALTSRSTNKSDSAASALSL